MDLAFVSQFLNPRAKTAAAEHWQQELSSVAKGEIRFNEPLKRHSWMQIGGPADALVFPQSREELAEILKFAEARHVPWHVLGLGSNMLIRDGGIRGLVLRLHKTLNQTEILEETAEFVRIRAEAGAALPKLVEQGRQGGWQGVEHLYGIPGSIGGVLAMNAGTRQGEIQAFVESLEFLGVDDRIYHYPVAKLKFSYRQLKLPQRGIILGGIFKFAKIDPVLAQARVADYQKRRQDSQPLDLPSLGSVFKNPPKGFAAQMIDELGLKGVRVGGARISEKHANFIVNERSATAHDVLALIGLIQDKVKEELEVKLELEVRVVGEEG